MQGNVLKLNSGYVPSRSVTSSYFPRSCNERRQSETQYLTIHFEETFGLMWEHNSTKYILKEWMFFFCLFWHISMQTYVSLKNFETFSREGLMTDLSWVFSVRYKLLFHLRLTTLPAGSTASTCRGCQFRHHILTFAGSLLRSPRAEKYQKGQEKCWHELIRSVMLASNALFFPPPSPLHHLGV